MANRRPVVDTIAYRQHYWMSGPPPQLPPPGMEYYLIGVRIVHEADTWGTVLYGLKPIEGSYGVSGASSRGGGGSSTSARSSGESAAASSGGGEGVGTHTGGQEAAAAAAEAQHDGDVGSNTSSRVRGRSRGRTPRGGGPSPLSTVHEAPAENVDDEGVDL